MHSKQGSCYPSLGHKTISLWRKLQRVGGVTSLSSLGQSVGSVPPPWISRCGHAPPLWISRCGHVPPPWISRWGHVPPPWSSRCGHVSPPWISRWGPCLLPGSVGGVRASSLDQSVGSVPPPWISRCGHVPPPWISRWGHVSPPWISRWGHVPPPWISRCGHVSPPWISRWGHVPPPWISRCGHVPPPWISRWGHVPPPWISRWGHVPPLRSVGGVTCLLPGSVGVVTCLLPGSAGGVTCTGCAKSSGPFLHFQKQMKLDHSNSTQKKNKLWLATVSHIVTCTSLLLNVAIVSRNDGFHTGTEILASLDDVGSVHRLSGIHDVRFERLQIWMG